MALGLALGLGSTTSGENHAFWAAASAPSTLYTPLEANSEESLPTAWCDGQGKASCAPATPVAPQQTVSFARALVAVLPNLRLRLSSDGDDRLALERVEDAREGVRTRVERPPRG